MQSEAPGEEEGEEIKSSKRKIIRVESEETQDYVREANDTGQEEGGQSPYFGVTVGAVKRP